MTPERLAALTHTFELDWYGHYRVNPIVWAAWLMLAYNHPTLTPLHYRRAVIGGIVFG